MGETIKVEENREKIAAIARDRRHRASSDGRRLTDVGDDGDDGDFPMV